MARLLVIGLLLAGVPAARADEPGEARARASALQAEGHRLLNAGDAERALDRFQEAYRLVPSPKVLFNMGRAYDKLGDAINAYECFDRFLAEAGDVPPESQAVAERSRAAARGRVALVELVAPAGATLAVDGRTVGRTPLPRPLTLAPGTRVFRLERDGTVLSEKAVPVAAGAVTRFVIDTTAPPARAVALRIPPPVIAPVAVPRRAVEPQPPVPFHQRWWFWTAVVAAVGVTVVVATGALSPRDASCPGTWQCP